MDRIDFVDSSKCHDLMPNYFGELMSMFEIINVYADKDISMNINTNNFLSLDLTLPSNEKANSLKGSLDRVEITNYDNKYVVETTLNKKTLNLRLNKVSG